MNKYVYSLLLLFFFCCAQNEKDSSPAAHMPAEVANDTSYYAGKIDKYPVVLQLIRKGNEISGAYYYLNKAKPIRLKGNKAQRVEMDELAEEGITGHFSLEMHDNLLTGKWKNKKTEFIVTLEKFTVRKHLP